MQLKNLSYVEKKLIKLKIIILYFFNYNNEKSFANLELPMIEEIIKHQSSKIIYVVTHYKKNDEYKKNKFWDSINF